MGIKFQLNFNNLTDSEKQIVLTFKSKRFAKLVRLTLKSYFPAQLYLDCRRDDKHHLYLVDGLLSFKGERFYAKAAAGHLSNALTEVAKRLRKAVLKTKSTG